MSPSPRRPLAFAVPLLGTLALAAGCGSSSSSSSSSAAAPAPASTGAPATSTPETTAAASTTMMSTASTMMMSTASAPATSASTAAAAGAGTVLKVSADPSGALKFMQMALTAKPGEVTIDFTNMSTVPHSVAIAKGATTLASTDVITQSTATTKVDLKAGTYTFFCTVPGHEQAGMKGTLTVG